MIETDASDTVLLAVDNGNSLYNALVLALEEYPQPADHRLRVAFQLSVLSFEHGTAVRNLIAAQLIVPALALLRPQLETLVRMDWIRCVAGEGWVESYVGVDAPGFNDRREFCGIDSLIEDLSSAPDCIHAGAYIKFRDEALPLFHSLTHGGVEAVNLTNGLDDQTQLHYLRVSNYMTLVASEVLAIVIGMEARARINAVALQFDDYLRDPNYSPPTAPATSRTSD